MTKKVQPYKHKRLMEQGKYPDRRTKLGQFVDKWEKTAREHFNNNLNPLQELELCNLLPLVVFVLSHPMKTAEGNISADFKWCWQRIENGLKTLVDLAAKDSKKPLSYLDMCELQNAAKRKG